MTSRLEELFEWRDRDRERKGAAVCVVKGKSLSFEHSPHGRMKWYLHPHIADTVIQSLLVYLQEIPPGGRTGKIRFQGDGWLYILEGHGYSVINGERVEWKETDLVMLPHPPEGCTYQSFNLDAEKPARFVAAAPNLLAALGPDGGAGLELLEAAPEWQSEEA